MFPLLLLWSLPWFAELAPFVELPFFVDVYAKFWCSCFFLLTDSLLIAFSVMSLSSLERLHFSQLLYLLSNFHRLLCQTYHCVRNGTLTPCYCYWESYLHPSCHWIDSQPSLTEMAMSSQVWKYWCYAEAILSLKTARMTDFEKSCLVVVVLHYFASKKKTSLSLKMVFAGRAPMGWVKRMSCCCCASRGCFGCWLLARC